MTVTVRNKPLVARKSLFGIFALLIMLCLGVVGVSAQAGTPLAVGQNATGETTATNAVARFTLQVTQPQTVVLQVLGITPGFAPSFTVIDPSGIQVQSVPNAGGPTTVQTPTSLSGIGAYTIEVTSASGVPGQFLISAQPGAPIQPPQPIQVGQSMTGQVSAAAVRQAYSFISVQTEVLLLTVTSSSPVGGPVVTLRDSETEGTLAMTSAQLSGVRYRLPAGSITYLVEVTSSGAPLAEGYTICLEAESSAGACGGGTGVAQAAPTAVVIAAPPTPLPVVQPVVIPSGGPCAVASATGGQVNLRNGPSTNNAIVGNLVGNTIAPVLGRLADGTWYQVSVNGVIGFVSATVVRVGGVCNNVTNIPLPTAVPPAATAIVLPTLTPTIVLIPITPEPMPTLNFSSPPNSGSMALAGGFLPDPFTKGITSGGTINVGYLGGGCTGYAISNPDFSVNYTAGSASLLRFYFVGNGDTTLIINGPSTSFSCNDDSYGTLNPSLDFANPTSGRYDIWIGSYSSGAFVNGTLNVTEVESNHP